MARTIGSPGKNPSRNNAAGRLRILNPARPRCVVRGGGHAGALILTSSTGAIQASVIGAYSLAATLGFVVLAVGLKSPIVAILAFVPMILTSIGYNELNKADPDCGTTFTWATRAFHPNTGWFGGWAIVAADVLVMASLAQVAGQAGHGQPGPGGRA